MGRLVKSKGFFVSVFLLFLAAVYFTPITRAANDSIRCNEVVDQYILADPVGYDENKNPPYETRCYNPGPEDTYLPGSNASTPLANKVTKDNWPYLQCYSSARNDCINQTSGTNAQCCLMPDTGYPGGRCFTSDEITALGLKNVTEPGELGNFADQDASPCKWYDLICHARRAVGNTIKNQFQKVVESYTGPIPDSFYACRHSFPVIIGPDNNTKPDPSCPDPSNPSCRILSTTNCRCASPILNTSVNPLTKLCFNNYIGVGDGELYLASIPKRFVMAGDTSVPNLNKKVKEEMEAFFGNDEKNDDFVNWKQYFLQGIVRSTPVKNNPLGKTYTGNLIKGLWEKMFGEEYVSQAVQNPLNDPRKEALSKSWRNGYISCLACTTYGGYPSALGCVSMQDPARFISELVTGIGLSIAGLVALCGLIISAIQFQLSQGDSTKIQKAQKRMVQFGTGLLFIIFSALILRIIGVNILGIYGLG